VVDIDWTVEAPQQKRTFRVDRVRATEAGASVEQITQTLYLALSGASTGIMSSPTAREGRAIVPRLPLEGSPFGEDALLLRGELLAPPIELAESRGQRLALETLE